MTGQLAFAALDTLVGCRAVVIGRAGGSAHLAARLLRDLGAEVEVAEDPTEVTAGDGRWDVVLVDDPGEELWADLGAKARHLLCAVESVRGGAAVGEQADLVTQAAAGHLLANGEAGDPPVPCGAPVARGAGALGAVLCVLAGWYARPLRDAADLVPERVRVNQVDILLTFISTLIPHYLLTGRDVPRIGNRHALTAPWNVYPASDGWVVMATMGERQWALVSDMLGTPPLAEDPRFVTSEDRIAHVEALDSEISARTSLRATADLTTSAEAVGVPLAEVLGAAEAPTHPQAQHRRQAAQALGTEGMLFRGLAGDSGPRRARGQASDGRLPLAGVRVLEVGLYTAAPVAGRLLALLGADVLKVEPPAGEPGRQLGSKIEGTSYLYFMNNTDKRACVLDLKSTEGQARMHDLLRDCDVLVSNLSDEALAAAGVDFATASRVSPGIVFCTISGYGASGPFRGRRVLDAVMQAVTGVMDVTGRAEGPPLKTAASTCDLVAAWGAAVSIVAALGDSARERGESQFLDVSLMDAATWLMREVPTGPTGEPQPRQGAADVAYAVHGVFEARGGDHVAVAVRDPDTFKVLAAGLGLGDEAADEALRPWVGARGADEAVAELRAAGVPAAAVLTPSQAAGQLLVELPLHGTTHQVFGSPVSWPTRDVRVRSSAPGLGQHDAAWLVDVGIERRGA